MPRIKKPTALHLITGNPSKIPMTNLLDSVNPPIEIPDMPDFLNEDAQIEWRRITPILYAQGVITQLDMAPLAAYCQCYGQWLMCEREITRLGQSGMYDERGKITGLLRHSQIAYNDMKKMAVEFGITPSARSRVQLVPKATAPTDDKKDINRFFR